MTNSFWSVASNWKGGSPQGDPRAALVFPATAANFISDNDFVSLTVQSIRFTGNKAYTIGGSALTLKSGGIGLDSSVTTATDRMILDIALAASQTWRVTSAGATLDVEGVVSGKYRLTKADAGTLILGGDNLYNGTTVSAGTLTLGSQKGLGPGALTLHGGTLASSMPLTLVNALKVTANSSIGGSNDLTFTGAASLSKGFTLTVVNKGTTTFSGKLSGAGTLAEAADIGTLVLAGANKHGGTALNSGTLLVLTNSALGTGDLTLNGGTLEAGTAVSLANAYSVSGSSTIGGVNNLILHGSGTLGDGTTLTVTNAGNTSLTGSVSGGGNLAMLGSGVLTLTGKNGFTGTTNVAAGTLLVDGSDAASKVTVQSGATLGGTGTVGPITTAGTVSPGGPSPGLLQSGSDVFAAGSSFTARLNGTNAGADYDQLAVRGDVDLTASPTLTTTVGFASSGGDTFTILTSTGSLTGTFAGLANGTIFTVNGINLQITYAPNAVILTNVAPLGPPSVRPPDESETVPPLPMGPLLDPATNAGARLSVAIRNEGPGQVAQKEQPPGKRGHERAGNPGRRLVVERHPQRQTLPLHAPIERAIRAADDPLGPQE